MKRLFILIFACFLSINVVAQDQPVDTSDTQTPEQNDSDKEDDAEESSEEQPQTQQAQTSEQNDSDKEDDVEESSEEQSQTQQPQTPEQNDSDKEDDAEESSEEQSQSQQPQTPDTVNGDLEQSNNESYDVELEDETVTEYDDSTDPDDRSVLDTMANDSVAKQKKKPIFKLAPYKQSMGVNIGTAFGISYKYFLKRNQAFELSVFMPYYDANQSFSVTGLYELEQAFEIGTFSVDGLYYYVGAGANIGSWEQKLEIGLTLAVGLEYKFKNSPLCLSADWRPSINMTGNTGVDPNQATLGIKYAF